MDTSRNTCHRRYPWVATFLSLLMPGLGQLYCGAIIKCLCVAGLISLFGLLSILALVLDFQLSAKLVIIFQVISLLLYGIGVVDAFLSARRIRGSYQLKDYNHWVAYILFYIAFSGGCIFSSLYFRDNLLQPFRVPSSAMFPAIWPGDRLLAAKNAYLSRNPQAGDIVIFRNPEDRRVFFLKRVVALAGDSVEIRDGDVYINDVKLKREAVAPPAVTPAQVPGGKYLEEWNGNATYRILLSENPAPEVGQFRRTVVPKNCCFVMGDNRDASLDSRELGAIPIVGIVGKASFIYAPAGNWSRFGTLR
jgi:signal peptidase I